MKKLKYIDKEQFKEQLAHLDREQLIELAFECLDAIEKCLDSISKHFNLEERMQEMQDKGALETKPSYKLPCFNTSYKLPCFNTSLCLV